MRVRSLGAAPLATPASSRRSALEAREAAQVLLAIRARAHSCTGAKIFQMMCSSRVAAAILSVLRHRQVLASLRIASHQRQHQ